MANILDEQERKRKELAAQGIHTRGVAGAKGGPAEMTYKPLEQRTGAEAKALGVSPQMQGQIAQEQGLIPPAALPTPAVTPSQAPAPQARGVAPQAAGVTPQAQAANRQLDLMRQEGMGTTNTSLTQLASRIDPSIKKDAERARQWRLMTPQQRRDEVDRLALEQDMRTADSVVSQDGIAKYARDLADPTGTFIDSYGRSNAIYSPETQIRIREHERKIEAQAADMFSSYDRTKWATEKDMYYAVASLPAVQEAGDLGKAIAFNIVRKYASPEMKAKMEAEDRNLDVFKRTFMSITDQEIDQMQQEMGGEYTNMGNEEFAKQIYINKDDNFRANSLVERVLERAGVRYTVENGRVVPDKGWAAQVKMREEERKAKDAADAKAEELKALEAYEDKKFAAIQQMNPERAAMMIKNPVTGKYDDLSQYAPEKQETNWDEIYQNDARVAAAESMMSWARFTNEAEAAAEAARQFPTRPDLPPTDAANQKALYDQQQAVNVWRTQINPPEKRAELEREIYNLKLRGQELRKGFKSPPAPEPTSGGYGLTMDLLGVGNQAMQDQYSSVSVRPQPQTPPSITPNPAIQSQQTGASSGRAGSSSPDRLSPDQIAEYEKTGKLVLNEEQLGNKVPILVKRKGSKRKPELLSPDEVIQIAKTSVMPVRIPDIDSVNLDKKTIDAIRNQLNKENPLGPPKEPYSDHYVKWYWSQKMRKYYEAVVEIANNEKYFA